MAHEWNLYTEIAIEQLSDSVSPTSGPSSPAHSRRNKAIIEITDLLMNHSRLLSSQSAGKSWPGTNLHTANPSRERQVSALSNLHARPPVWVHHPLQLGL
jgi:hypothetical protein